MLIQANNKTTSMPRPYLIMLCERCYFPRIMKITYEGLTTYRPTEQPRNLVITAKPTKPSQSAVAIMAPIRRDVTDSPYRLLVVMMSPVCLSLCLLLPVHLSRRPSSCLPLSLPILLRLRCSDKEWSCQQNSSDIVRGWIGWYWYRPCP